MSVINRKKVTQIGILVWDLDKAAAAWKKYLGVEPYIGETADYQVTGATYKGEACYGRIKQAMFDLDNIQIELIAPIGDEPSIWHDYLEEHGEGIHHIAFSSDDTDAAVQELEQDGKPVIQYGTWPAEPRDGRYTYLDAQDDLKVILEILDC